MAERTLVIASSYPAHEGDPSGHFVKAQAESLARAGDHVQVVVPGRALPFGVGEGDLFVHRVGGEALFSWPGAVARLRERPSRSLALAPLSLRLFLRLRRLDRFDRIVAHWLIPSAFPWAGWVAEHNRSARLDVFVHGADARLLRSMPSALRAAILGRLIARGARFFVVAKSLLDDLMQSLPRALASELAARSTIEPCPISVPSREELADPRDGQRWTSDYAVWVGRDIPTKRLELAIEAARLAGVQLVVVGAPTPTSAGSPDLHCLGAVDRREALAWIAHASVLLSTSSEEGAPTAVREARMLGIPVVACPAGDLESWASTDPEIRVVDARAPALAQALAERLRARAPGSRAPRS